MRGIALAILGVGLMRLTQNAPLINERTRKVLTFVSWVLMIASLGCVAFGV